MQLFWRYFQSPMTYKYILYSNFGQSSCWNAACNCASWSNIWVSWLWYFQSYKKSPQNLLLLNFKGVVMLLNHQIVVVVPFYYKCSCRSQKWCKNQWKSFLISYTLFLPNQIQSQSLSHHFTIGLILFNIFPPWLPYLTPNSLLLWGGAHIFPSKKCSPKPPQSSSFSSFVRSGIFLPL